MPDAGCEHCDDACPFSRGRFFETVLWSATAVTVYGVAVLGRLLLLTGRALPDPI